MFVLYWQVDISSLTEDQLSIREAVHLLLSSLCTSVKLGIVFHDRFFGSSKQYCILPFCLFLSCLAMLECDIGKTSRLDIPRARRTTIVDRAFCVAGFHAWNSLSSSTQNAPSLPVFRRLLKCEPFCRWYGNHTVLITNPTTVSRTYLLCKVS